ncbi:hypothetical protein C1646_704355 [Rhizophagus diaphanus]|nr:hypothetical protein C1646_704355 [Rhizophagus diaphanus] [Rhizophagus sp. MUCL 43196]
MARLTLHSNFSATSGLSLLKLVASIFCFQFLLPKISLEQSQQVLFQFLLPRISLKQSHQGLFSIFVTIFVTIWDLLITHV